MKLTFFIEEHNHEVLCFVFMNRADSESVFWLLLNSACTASRLLLFPTAPQWVAELGQEAGR